MSHIFIGGINQQELPNINWEIAKPHDDILEAVFSHRKLLSKQFSDVLGLHHIDHIAIDVINPDMQWVSLTSTPSMLYNLITSGLWVYDGLISPGFIKKYCLYNWDSAYSFGKICELRKIKEYNYNYVDCISLTRRINSFFIVYSFASKKEPHQQNDFLQAKLDDLFKIGDFCLKNLKKIYGAYDSKFILPTINNSLIKNEIKPNLQLIINNDKKERSYAR